MNERIFFGVVMTMVFGGCSSVRTQQLVREEPAKMLLVRETEDFVISGSGDALPWMKADWEQLNLRNTDGHQYGTRIKMLYSNSGLYILMEALTLRGETKNTEGHHRCGRFKTVRCPNYWLES